MPEQVNSTRGDCSVQLARSRNPNQERGSRTYFVLAKISPAFEIGGCRPKQGKRASCPLKAGCDWNLLEYHHLPEVATQPFQTDCSWRFECCLRASMIYAILSARLLQLRQGHTVSSTLWLYLCTAFSRLSLSDQGLRPNLKFYQLG